MNEGSIDKELYHQAIFLTSSKQQIISQIERMSELEPELYDGIMTLINRTLYDLEKHPACNEVVALVSAAMTKLMARMFVAQQLGAYVLWLDVESQFIALDPRNDKSVPRSDEKGANGPPDSQHDPKEGGNPDTEEPYL